VTAREHEGEPVTHYGKLRLTTDVQIRTAAQVEHALNGIRLAVLGILVTIFLSVFFGMSGPWLERLAWGAASLILACLLVGLRRSRKFLMMMMERLIER
jgi:hypothetical protein